MGSQRGQATVEWIGLVLLLALGLGALARLAPRPDGRGLGAALVHSVTCAAGGGCDAERDRPTRLVTAPPPVPVVPTRRRVPRPHPRRLPRLPPAVVERTRRGARLAWRSSWLICLGYERLRYDQAHPEMRFPGQTIPAADRLRIANDCLSPVDLVRDWGSFPGPR